MLAGMIHRFVYLKLGLAVVLTYVGVKMLVSEFYKIPVWASLAVIAIVLTVSIVASLRHEVPDDEVVPDPTERGPAEASTAPGIEALEHDEQETRP